MARYTVEPLPLEPKLGGLFQKMILRITFPKVVGFLQIQHFLFVPPDADDAETEGTALWFQAWLNELKAKIVGDVLPQLKDEDTKAAIAEAAEKVKVAVKAQDGTRGHGPQKEADKVTNEISKECLQVTMPLLGEWMIH